MPLTRRQFIASTAAATALAPIPGWAANTLQMGDIRIDTLSDGHLVLPTRFALGNRSAEEAAPILARHGITGPQLEPPCNVTLVRDGTNTVLFDVGAGPDFMSSAGRLMDAFDLIQGTPGRLTWMTLAEFWNDGPSEEFTFRITLAIHKEQAAAGSPLSSSTKFWRISFLRTFHIKPS